MAESRETGTEGTAPLSLRERFIAWWEGYDLAFLLRLRAKGKGDDSARDGSQASDPAHQNRSGKPLWTATRIQVAEKIWGDGFATPGGSDHIPTLVKPLGLSPAMSVLDLGAGLGGSTRAMAKQYGAWITGLEHNPVLAEAGMFRSTKAGLARQAPVKLTDLEKFSWPKRVDSIFSKEAFYVVRNKDKVFDAIEACLKPRGQLLFTDYAIDPDHPKGRDYDSWLKHEPVEPHPWTVQQYSTALQMRNMDIRIAEDITEKQVHMILTAIQELVDHLKTVTMDRETKMAVVEEVELWARRVAAMSSGIRCYRFHALKPAELA